MDRAGYPSDIFASHAPHEVVNALTHKGLGRVRVERPDPKTRWNVIVATR